MKKILWVCLLGFGVMLSWSIACAENFYVIPVKVDKKNYAPVEKTGQIESYRPHDDGDLGKGIAWPVPRFTDNKNGTVTDNLTGLIWLKNANCARENIDWYTAIDYAAELYDGSGGCDLSDGSKPGDWRLPNVRELHSLIDFVYLNPALSNAAGTGQWEEKDPFIYVQAGAYWTSTTGAGDKDNAWAVGLASGNMSWYNKKTGFYVWCVRDGN